MDGLPAEKIERAATALRYVLWWSDCADWCAAGGHPDDTPPCPVPDEDLAGLADALAALAYAARRALAEQQGAAPDEQHDKVQSWMRIELEGYEIAATFAAVDAEMQG